MHKLLHPSPSHHPLNTCTSYPTTTPSLTLHPSPFTPSPLNPPNPLPSRPQVSNLGLSDETIRALHGRGIQSLFPIQRMVLQPAMEGRDLIGRAKTGSGKTLAFALPVIEGILEEDRKSAGEGSARRRAAPVAGRAPRCLVLAPTRELANQVGGEGEGVAGGGVKVISVLVWHGVFICVSVYVRACRFVGVEL